MWFKNTRLMELEQQISALNEKIFGLNEHMTILKSRAEYYETQTKIYKADLERVQKQNSELLFENEAVKEHLRETKGKLHEKLIKKQRRRDEQKYQKNAHAQKQEA